MATSSTQSRLLQLHRELRDVVYEYPLTEPDGLTADAAETLTSPSWYHASASDSSTQPNQLRLVCRQLHFETSALSLAHNNLILKGPQGLSSPSVYALFDKFLEAIASTKITYTHQITLFDNATAVPESQVHLPTLLSPSLIRFCAQNPKAKVLVRFDWLKTRDAWADKVIDVMTHLALALGRANPFRFAGARMAGGVADKVYTHFLGVEYPANLLFSVCNNAPSYWCLWLNARSLMDEWEEIDPQADVDGVVEWLGRVYRAYRSGL